jgi:FMN phosphatase YigB (HAD superfamily)
MYRHASDALGLAPADCLFVDDDPELVAAAVALGYQGLAMVRGADADADARGVPAIRSLTELLDLV